MVHTTRRGFTLVEILISLVILLVAFAGILSLLLASTRQAGQVVEDTFASTLARSVYEAARAGVRERSFAITESDGDVVRGFVLVHEGVGDGSAPPVVAGNPGAATLGALKASENAIFLPATTGVTDPAAPPPEVTFVFPRPGGASDNDEVPYGKDNGLATPADNEWGQVDMDITRIYELPAGGVDAADAGDAGAEAEAPDAGPTGPDAGDGVDGTVVDPVSGKLLDARNQYGFALVVRRASAPPLLQADGSPVVWDDQDHLPTGLAKFDGLYMIRVLVFRNFDADKTVRQHLPVAGGDFSGLVAVGP